MIRFLTLGSSSAGNAYLVDDGATRILIEAGIRYADLKTLLHHQVSSVAATLVSHSHADHSKATRELAKRGVDVMAQRVTLDALGLTGHRAVPMEPHQTVRVGTWSIFPFDLRHDVPTLGFLMASDAGGKLAYLSDTYYCPYRFEGLTHLAVEANYSLELLDRNIAEGRVPPSLRGRILRSHFSLDHALDFLRAIDRSQLQEVHLLHLSASNSDAHQFRHAVQGVVGCPVYVAGERGGFPC